MSESVEYFFKIFTRVLLKTRNSGGVGKTVVLKYDVDTLKISDLNEGTTNKASDTNYPSSIQQHGVDPLMDSSSVPVMKINNTSSDIKTTPSNDLPPALARLLDKTKR